MKPQIVNRRAFLQFGAGMVLAATAGESAWGQQSIPASSPLSKPVLKPSRVGVWYTAWWDSHDQFGHWKSVRNQNALPTLGKYTARDTKTIRAQYNAMREAGVTFVIFDDTNTLFVDNSVIDHTILAWYDFMDALPEADRLELCVAFGGELNQHKNKAGHQEASDYLFRTFANRPSQMRVDGRPLLLWYIETDVLDDWNDVRWNVKRTYHFLRTPDQAKHGGWGWGSHVLPPENAECMSIKPGWYGGPPSQPWPRREGDTYMECWLRVLQVRPRFVTVADWNNWAEETAIEDSPFWKDSYGDAAPRLYRQITRAYAAILRRNELLSGYCYREDESDLVYRWNGRVLERHENPHHAPVILLPRGWLAPLTSRRI